MRQRRAWVTGGTGFIGSRWIAKMVQNGWEVTALVRKPVSSAASAQAIPAGAQIFVFDATQDSVGKLTDALKREKPEIVFHIASNFIGHNKPEDVKPLIESNVLLGSLLCEAMVEAGVLNLVNVGTSWQHFGSSEYNPVSLYAATKQAFQDLVRHYTENRGLRAVHLKLFDTYGLGDSRPKLLNLIRTEWMKREQAKREPITEPRHGEPITEPRHGEPTTKPMGMTGGEQWIDLLHIDDVLSGFQAASERFFSSSGETAAHNPAAPPMNEVFSLTSGHPMRVRELVEEIFRVTGRSFPIQWGARPYRPREMMEPWNAGPALPAWKPKVSLDAGLKEFFKT